MNNYLPLKKAGVYLIKLRLLPELDLTMPHPEQLEHHPARLPQNPDFPEVA